MNMVKPPLLTESQEQRALVRWIRFQPKIRDLIIKLNNEGERSPAQGWNLKMMGLLPGASDLFLAYPCGKWHGLFIEMKRRKKYSLSERSTPTWIQQEAFQKRMREVGFAAETCYGWDEGVKVIEDYLRTSDEIHSSTP